MAPFRVLALECLTDIAQIEIDPTKHSSFGYANQLKSMFRTLMLKFMITIIN
uniref:Uncharacterized protein n=1 Tax=Heterorhabditis bacteriophora TaxID=37862 RepID=A0A1I7X0X3_HETBA